MWEGEGVIVGGEGVIAGGEGVIAGEGREGSDYRRGKGRE